MKFSDINIRDPFVVLHDNKYYMYGTRGNESWTDKATGLDAYVSDDLENWTEIKDVFIPPENFWATKNFWAPEVHFYKGSFYMFVSFYSEGKMRGTQILKSEKAEGPFILHSDGPVTPDEWMCLDGTLVVDDGKPYIVFCHEWVQVKDGEMWALELTDDLKQAKGEPIYLFKASEPWWADKTRENYVTDGPFAYRTEGGKLMLIWSSFYNGEYCQAMIYSDNGHMDGKWTHDDRLLFEKDGGHGMIFRTRENELKLILHSPNQSLLERPVMFNLKEENDTLYIK